MIFGGTAGGRQILKSRRICWGNLNMRSISIENYIASNDPHQWERGHGSLEPPGDLAVGYRWVGGVMGVWSHLDGRANMFLTQRSAFSNPMIHAFQPKDFSISTMSTRFSQRKSENNLGGFWLFS